MKELSNIKNSGEQPSNSTEKAVDQILDILDLNEDIPVGLVDKVMERKQSLTINRNREFDYSKYLQIAAVFITAVLLGVLLGKNADIKTFNKKQSKEDRALIELKEKHHLSENYSFERL